MKITPKPKNEIENACRATEKMAWVLIAIPEDCFGEISLHVEAIRGVREAIVETGFKPINKHA